MRTKQIHLVLVTSLLTSCSRMIIPNQHPPNNAVDSTQIAEDSVNNCSCYYNYPYDDYYYLPWNFQIYWPGRIYRRQAFWRNYRFVVKGGFGRAAGGS